MENDQSETDHCPDPTVSVDSIPAPVLAYEVPDERPVIAGTNGSFEATFGPVPTGKPMGHWLREEVGAAERQVEEVCSSLADGESVDTDLDGDTTNEDAAAPRQYRVRTFEGPSDGPNRRILLTESLLEAPDSVETDRIASVISHDLRNPLDVANAHLRAARETGAEEHFDEVRQSHDRMEQIIQDVLTLARGESALSISAAVDIAAVATDAWASVDTTGAELALEGSLPAIEADPDRLQRLFENLFRNSVEHADADGSESADPDGDLRVLVGSTDGGFFVADDGAGIPPEDRAQVFDPGFSRGETGGGTGLGLTIVERIAQAHDWTVSLTTGPLGGARFEFRPSSAPDGGNGGLQP